MDQSELKVRAAGVAAHPTEGLNGYLQLDAYSRNFLS